VQIYNFHRKFAAQMIFFRRKTAEFCDLPFDVNGDLLCDNKSQKNTFLAGVFKENVCVCAKSRVENVCITQKTRRENVCISAWQLQYWQKR
jgi:hypothetical protein